MTVSLFTDTLQFSNDLADVIRVFLGNITLQINKEGGELTIRHTEMLADGKRSCRITAEGLYTESRESTVSVYDDALLEKRYHKRQMKQLLYEVMKEATGCTPPWGSLTGIRPSRLIYEGMQRGVSMREATERVKTEFDVADCKAELLAQIVSVQMEQPQPKGNEVDLYVGIPFCVSRCAYCSFLSGEVGKGKQLPPYVDALEREIAFTLQLIQQKELKPRAFYMGGGTPTSLSAPLLERVLKAVRPFIDRACEVTIEAGRPDTIDVDKLMAIRDNGANRISINPQTKHDTTLQRIGRNHTAKQTEDAYALARRIGFHHINMDLIAGLPGENLDMFLQTLAWSRAMHPESLTVHTLSIKRSSLLHLWEAELPDGDMVADMVDAGRVEAYARSMQPYYLYRQKYMAGNLENVGYALTGHACLYNIDMMEETANVLAVGAGAISKRVYCEQGRIERAPNVSEISHYIERTEEMMERKQALWLPDIQ